MTVQRSYPPPLHRHHREGAVAVGLDHFSKSMESRPSIVFIYLSTCWKLVAAKVTNALKPSRCPGAITKMFEPHDHLREGNCFFWSPLENNSQ
jgi:hypothetical protein